MMILTSLHAMLAQNRMEPLRLTFQKGTIWGSLAEGLGFGAVEEVFPRTIVNTPCLASGRGFFLWNVLGTTL